ALRRGMAGAAVAALCGGLLIPVALTDTAQAAPAAAPGAALPAVTQDVSPLSAFDAELLRLVNVARTGAGVTPLQEARGLDGLTGWWSSRLAAGTGALAHNPDGLKMVTGYGAATRTRWAENVAKLTPSGSVTAQGLFDTYLASPSQKANLLNPQFGYIGVATVSTAAGVGFNTINFTDAADAGQTFAPKAALTPIGQFESLTLDGATVRVTGWGLEPELAAAASTVTFADTAPDGTVVYRTTSASVMRAELAAVYPKAGSGHGFDASFVASGRGDHTLCATVADTGTGLGDVKLGCLGYTVGNPIGAFDGVALTGRSAAFSGWAVDPDQPTKPATVTVSDRVGTGPATTVRIVADSTNSGVDAAVPGAGTAHGFTGSMTLAGVGEHTLCTSVAGIRATQVVTDLGCKTVTVAAAAPVGGLDTVTSPDRRSVVVTGWASDPDQPTLASTVVVAITNRLGTTRTTLSAEGAYTIALAAGLGQSHGFSGLVPLTADGTNTVCATAVSRSSATVTTDLGCRDVTVGWLQGWLDKVTPAVSAGNRTLAVAGWAIDQGAPTTPAPVTLTVTGPAGTTTTVVQAGALRADVGRVFAGTGSNHGFLTSVAVARAGAYTVCAGVASLRDATQFKQLRCVSLTVS
ncbi:MAG: CAP domain-containing protein, partial [Nakamurella sp.]